MGYTQKITSSFSIRWYQSSLFFSFFFFYFYLHCVEEPGFQCEAGRSFENAPRGSPKIFVHDTPYKTGFTTSKVGMQLISLVFFYFIRKLTYFFSSKNIY